MQRPTRPKSSKKINRKEEKERHETSIIGKELYKFEDNVFD